MGGRQRIRLADGPAVTLETAAETAADGTATFAVRPERLVLDGSAPPLVSGTLAQVVYMGTDLRVQVDLSDGTSLALRVSPPFEHLQVTPGAVATVGVAPQFLRPLAVEQ